ncbi:MAG: hypothetical protein ABJN65_05905 [Parasphingorhabdus sp.]
MANTRHEWWHDLAALSPIIATFALPPDEPYWDNAKGQAINTAAFNISGCAHHNRSITRWIDVLANEGVSLSQIEKLLVDLTSRNTYGSFSELAAYGLLIDSNIPFEIQVSMKGTAILNPNGSDLDGAFMIGDPVFFDVKAFGLHEYLAEQLKLRLSNAFPSEFVEISGSSDVGVADMTELLGTGFSLLISELTSNQKARRGKLEVQLKKKRRVQFVINTANPYELAETNADYAFKFAKQFVRRKPFVLIFVTHPWLGGLRLSQNFAGDADNFMRSFARRTFMQFRSDRKKVLGVTRAAASRLLSGIMFVDASQLPSSTPPCHALYLNPFAKHPLSKLTRHRLATDISDIRFDDFQHDAY